MAAQQFTMLLIVGPKRWECHLSSKNLIQKVLQLLLDANCPLTKAALNDDLR